MATENDHDETDGQQPIQAWTDWLDRWRAQRPAGPVDGEDQDGAVPPKRRFSAFTFAMVLAGVIVVAVMVVAVTRFAGTADEPDPFEAAVPPPTSAPAPAATTDPEDQDNDPGTTTGGGSTPQCVEDDSGDTLTTSKGGEVTSPQTLIAEFQHRYFDLRDGAAVAELWDEGYDADGFQATIDDSLADLEGRAAWCLTVAPAESGWWATEVSWWQQGDQKVRETWYGTYEIERRGSGYIFTDASTE
ncbi:hypothetical protein G6016_08860 [Dietzia aerolata]|uniref:DUF8176 domain-containing protein n=1 Tax=Dietzia aerolata TaxID=595984 RepID=A0ABV5JTE9_9ACTN|nr:hypothetical protein [Dietzia aerolata]MBB0969066.1 hypothetical protein [Dietzia aerolata]